MRSYRPEELFDARRPARARAGGAGPEGRATHGRQSARQRRQGAARPRPARLPRLRDRGDDAGDGASRVHPAARASSCATSSRGMRGRRTSGSSAPTRPTRIAWATCSRSRTAASSAASCRPTITSSPDGRVMEVLSEHSCQGWLEGYTLTGRHGLFATYEAFAMVSASMTVQHAKWLEEASQPRLAKADPLAQHPADLDLLAQRSQRLQPSGPGPDRRDAVQEGHGGADLPAARRQLPALGGRPLPAQPELREPHRHRQAAAAAVARHGRGRSQHCARGASIWRWASNDGGGEPDVVLAAAGDIPTLETVAAAWWLRRARAGRCKVRVVNVVDLMALFPPEVHPHGMDETSFVDLFTRDAPRDLRLSRLPASDPPARARAARLPNGSTCAASTRRAPPPRPSTWWSATA